MHPLHMAALEFRRPLDWRTKLRNAAADLGTSVVFGLMIALGVALLFWCLFFGALWLIFGS